MSTISKEATELLIETYIKDTGQESRADEIRETWLENTVDGKWTIEQHRRLMEIVQEADEEEAGSKPLVESISVGTLAELVESGADVDIGILTPLQYNAYLGLLIEKYS
jgi:hypothetical protein